MPWTRPLRYLALAGQLALLLFVFERRFHPESVALHQIVKLAAAGFLVHALLPRRLRTAFFALLSIGGIGWVLGPKEAVWLVGTGLALLGLCHLPARFAVRVAAVIAAGAVLVALRAGAAPVPWSAAVWPILGSMFMFRMIVYLYDLRHERAPVSFWKRVSYFFLLPNVCFPLFPVVDWATFARSDGAADPLRVAQKGMQWMFRGFLHLVLYRLVYYWFSISMDQVASGGDLARFLVANYLLYLRISGQFHLVVGMLCLFGFDLPETNRLYVLASSLTDYWRRINIYWKDFMVKVFYMPAFFRMKALGPTPAMVLATVAVFVVTWALHSYQWFWLRGSFPVTAPDILFWSLLGLLVVVNSLHEAAHGRRRSLTAAAWSLRDSFLLALRTLGIFALVCVLWSVWTAGSLAAWLALWGSASEDPLGGTGPVAAVVVLLLAGGTLARWLAGRVPAPRVSGDKLLFWRSAAATSFALVLVSVVGHYSVYSKFGKTVADVVLSLRESRLSQGDLALLQRGYYEELLGVERINSQLWELYMKEPPDWAGDPDEMYRLTGDFLYREHVPGIELKAKGLMTRMNQWGMRDREYAQVKPEGCFRIALIGDSYGVGLGVEEQETWQALLEGSLAEDPPAPDYVSYEVLNFSVGGYRTVQRLAALEQRALGFDPDAVIFMAREIDAKSFRDVSDALRLGVPIPYEPVAEAARGAGVGPDTPEAIAERRLHGVAREILTWTYGEFVRKCRERGVAPIWMFLPTTGEREKEQAHALLLELAQQAGFVIVDLADVWDGRDLSSLWLGEWDEHPNATGHELIAGRVEQVLREQPAVFSAPSPR
ncbi:MAG: SGNH/GDSL hydrolase family protein [Candidatus Eiseniibacteriota bacterium]